MVPRARCPTGSGRDGGRDQPRPRITEPALGALQTLFAYCLGETRRPRLELEVAINLFAVAW